MLYWEFRNYIKKFWLMFMFGNYWNGSIEFNIV